MKIKITKTWTKEYIDLWIGVYWNRKDKRIYFGFLLIGFNIQWGDN